MPRSLALTADRRAYESPASPSRRSDGDNNNIGDTIVVHRQPGDSPAAHVRQSPPPVSDETESPHEGLQGNDNGSDAMVMTENSPSASWIVPMTRDEETIPPISTGSSVEQFPGSRSNNINLGVWREFLNTMTVSDECRESLSNFIESFPESSDEFLELLRELEMAIVDPTCLPMSKTRVQNELDALLADPLLATEDLEIAKRIDELREEEELCRSYRYRRGGPGMEDLLDNIWTLVAEHVLPLLQDAAKGFVDLFSAALKAKRKYVTAVARAGTLIFDQTSLIRWQGANCETLQEAVQAIDNFVRVNRQYILRAIRFHKWARDDGLIVDDGTSYHAAEVVNACAQVWTEEQKKWRSMVRLLRRGVEGYGLEGLEIA